MARTSTLGSSGGVHFKEPREFMRSNVAATILATVDAAGSATNSGVAGFFTEMGKRGLADDTNWTADTYKTVLSISSGSGLVAYVIGPTGLSGTPTTTFEITVDGVLSTVAVVATTTGQRAVLGPIFPHASMFTTTLLYQVGSNSVNAGKDTGVYSTNAATVGWGVLRGMGTPCLSFKTSLLIRIKSSESNSTTTAQERQSAVQYVSAS
jgi:hypothetical protein